jgi:hypothetical protein
MLKEDDLLTHCATINHWDGSFRIAPQVPKGHQQKENSLCQQKTKSAKHQSSSMPD